MLWRSTMKQSRSAWRVHILRCRDGSLYTGTTNDLGRRVERHAAGRGARYTRSRLPVALAYEEHARGLGLPRLGGQIDYAAFSSCLSR
jgi:predicted GIY-YIG superfamily endonuclease